MTHRSQRDIVFVERESSSPLWWLVAGGALGAGLALLFAPEQGSQTRRILARRLARLRSSAEELLRDPEAEAAGKGEAGAEDKNADDEDNAPSARDELEKRLAAARARRQRELPDEDEEPVA